MLPVTNLVGMRDLCFHDEIMWISILQITIIPIPSLFFKVSSI